MNNSVYQINKGINQSIQFKGLRAQYIWYMGAGVVILLIVFAVMYIVGLPPYICVVVVLVLGTFLTMQIYGMSNKYGEHGLMKALARTSIPHCVKVNSRKLFISINRSTKQ